MITLSDRLKRDFGCDLRLNVNHDAVAPTFAPYYT